jgi:hypothetical protein
MSVSVVWAMNATTQETLAANTGSAADASRVVTHSQYDEGATLNAGSTPPATLPAFFLGTLGTGALTINLASLTGTNGALIDMTGLRVQILRVKNLGANSMTFAEGGSNGIALSCLPFTVPSGGVAMFYLADASPDIASGDRTIDVTGSGSQTFECSIICG